MSSELIQSSESTQPISSCNSPVHPGALIILAMSQSDIDLDRMEKLFELQKSYEDNEAKKEFHRAMAKFRSECPTIVNRDAVDFSSSKGRTNYTYAGLSSTIAQIKPALAVCELSHNWKVEQKDGGVLHVTCFITHSKGYQTSTTMFATADNTGNKNSIQAMKSTVSYLERITLFALLGLASQDDDDDGHTSRSPEVSEAVKNNFNQGNFYPQDQFDKNFPAWAKKIESGAKTSEQMIEFLNKKTKLSKKQIELLTNIEVTA